jgi:nitroreductase
MATPRNATTKPIHDLLADRWSPRGFDASFEISTEQMRTLFEAARWSPSAFNAQPWAFIAGRRGTDTFQHIHDGLLPFNQLWTSRVSALVLTLAQVVRDGEPFATAHYDLGQAVAHLTFQAEALDIDVHQMTGFDREKFEFEIPEGYEIVSAIALGRYEDSDEIPEKIRERDASPRARKPVEEIVLVRD